MERISGRWYQILTKLNEQRHLYSIRITFISTMPIMIVGAYAVVLNQLPIKAYQGFMGRLFGPNWHVFGDLAFNGTTQIVALMVVFLTCSNLAKWYNSHRDRQVHDGICGIVGLACYLVVSLPISPETSIPFNILGVNGLFVALLIGVVSGEAMVRLSCLKSTTDLLSDDPNVTVPQSLASIVPALIVIGGFLLLRIFLVASGVEEGLSDLVTRFLSLPYRHKSGSIGSAMLYNISTHVMWLFGVHGNNVLDGIAQSFFAPAMESNMAAVAAGVAPPNLITKTLFDTFVYMGGSGTSIALLLALFLFNKSQSHRTLLRYALPNSIFNINEPLIFGIPVVLNPFYAIPFVLTPVLIFFSTALAMNLGFVPYTTAEVSWDTPILFSGYLATGSLAGSLLQLFNLFLAVLVYMPFVKMADKFAQEGFEKAFQNLLHEITYDYHPSRKLIHRVDEVGAVARRLSNQIDGALTREELFLHYQPIVDVDLKEMRGVEALLRWNHPLYGPISPVAVVTLAEETHRASRLGLWVLEKAIAQRAQWNKEGLGDFYVSVNISPKQLEDPNFSNAVMALSKKHGMPLNLLQLEITEAMALVENASTNHNLQDLHRAGVAIAMDDFGVGHSSLLYLRTQPITTLKIDGSLSRDVTKHPSALDIISTIFDLCRIMKITPVVEYVENKAQLDKLLGVGTFLIQGYLFSPPLAGDQIPLFLADLLGSTNFP